MCGIFAYLNHLTPKTRAEVIDILLKVTLDAFLIYPPNRD